MRRLFGRVASSLGLCLAVASASACESGACGGHGRDNDDNAPMVESFYVLSQDKQIPGDPWTVVFGIEFEDRNGDLGSGGRAEFYLNDNDEPTPQELDSVFRQSGLASDAESGAMWVTLRFADETVDDGTRVRLGIQLVDAAELRSNCFTLDLEFDVSPAEQALRVRSQRHAAGGTFVNRVEKSS